MGIDVIRGEDGNEYTERIPDYQDPNTEPGAEETAEVEIEGGYSTEPPFPQETHPARDLDLDFVLESGHW